MTSACPVMTAEEIQNLDDAMAHHQSAKLERQVREQAARCAESCLAAGKPWRAYFMAPIDFAKADAFDGTLPRSVSSVEVTVDVRGALDPFAAKLIAEEQIRRQLAAHEWAQLPDLAASR